ncbi:hypothetical protein PROPEN_04414 [Proteus penneri ATCC 35198]|nr:hypothetical protein PROPEN_04414 [Proteus penneri ATCC 35198]
MTGSHCGKISAILYHITDTGASSVALFLMLCFFYSLPFS